VGVLRRTWPLLAVAGLLGLVAIGASLGSLPLSRISIGPPQAQRTFDQATRAAPDPDVNTSGDTTATMPTWLTTAAALLCAGIVLAVVVLLVVQLLRNVTPRRRRLSGFAIPPAAPQATGVESVVAAVDAGIEALDADDSDPRRAVIACWVRLEGAAAAAGTPRGPGDTPTDLVLRLLSGQRISGAVLNGFADVYRAARYAPHIVDEAMRDQARSALRLLRDELSERVVAE
jgi:hypothetical protein